MYHGAKSSVLAEKHCFPGILGSGNKHSCKVWGLNNNVSQCGSLTTIEILFWFHKHVYLL